MGFFAWLAAGSAAAASRAAPCAPPWPRTRRRSGRPPTSPSTRSGPGGAPGPGPGRRPWFPARRRAPARRAGGTEAGTPSPSADAATPGVATRARSDGPGPPYGRTPAFTGPVAPAVPRTGRGGGRENRPRAPRAPRGPRRSHDAPQPSASGHDRPVWLCASVRYRRDRVSPGSAPARPARRCASVQHRPRRVRLASYRRRGRRFDRRDDLRVCLHLRRPHEEVAALDE